MNYRKLYLPLGAGLTTVFTIILAYVLNLEIVLSYGVLGAFSFLSFQDRTIVYNIKAVLIHGICLYCSLVLGLFASNYLVIVPFVISLINFIGFFFVKLYNIPRPAHFYCIMLFAIGMNKDIQLFEIMKSSTYFFIGFAVSILIGLIWIKIMHLPWNEEKNHKLNFLERFDQALSDSELFLLVGFVYSLFFFIAGYIAVILASYRGYWVLICAASILSEEEISVIKTRSAHSLSGSLLGLLLGLIISNIAFSEAQIVLVLFVMQFCAEYFLRKNYAIANIFVNPQMMVLTSLSSGGMSKSIVGHRLISVVVACLVTTCLCQAFSYCLKKTRQQLQKNLDQNL